MKTRTSEAGRLEQEYLQRVREALVRWDAGDIDEVIDSVRDHIEEELAGFAGAEVTLVQMASVLERLGPPRAYAEQLGDAVPSAEVVEGPGASTCLTVAECMNEAAAFYAKNMLLLVVAAVVLDALSIVSLLILAGPLFGGVMWMSIRGLRREDRTVRIGDMFDIFDRFWPLLGLMILEVICTMVGFALLIVPGVLLGAIWLYTQALVVDQKKGVFESMGESCRMAQRGGMWFSIGLSLIVSAIYLVTIFIPYVGIVVGWFITPLAWSLIAVAYVRQVDRAMPVGE